MTTKNINKKGIQNILSREMIGKNTSCPALIIALILSFTFHHLVYE
jgi:hypothetical protein